jgi:ligand-binding sensor domain-containing protein
VNSTRALVVLGLGIAAFAAGCGDDDDPPVGPDPPEQIALSAAYGQASNGLPSNDVSAFLTTSEGEFWIGTRAGVAIYATPKAATSQDIVNEVDGLPHPQVTSMVEHAGKVYVGTWGGGLGIQDIAANTWTQLRPSPAGLANGFVAGLAASETEGKIYAATNDGVYIYDLVGWEHFSTVDPVAPEGDTDTPKLQQIVSSVEIIDTVGVV